MDQSFFKRLMPHGIAVLVFLIAAVIFCSTALKGDMMLSQSDTTSWKAMAQQSFEYKKENGHFPLWITSMFSGMPGYQVAMDGPWQPSSILHALFTLGLPKPMNFFFLACLSFYFMALCIRVKPYIAIIGALGFAYSSFSPIIISAGHDTQMLALAYVPALLGSIFMIYEKRYAWGFVLATIFTMLQIGMNHPQISYYFFIIAAILTVFYIVKWVQQKDYVHIGKALGLVTVAGILGLMVSAVSLLPVYEFVKFSKRGGQLMLEQTEAGSKASKTKGLSMDYAFQWSYGKSETLTLMFPGAKGYGSRGAELGEKSHIVKYLQDKINQPEDQAIQTAASFAGAIYWGDQPFTEGPVYLGAVICFLFIFAMAYLKTRLKWWMLASCILAVLMAWGINFTVLNALLFEHLPFYNKFRAPTMALVIPQIIFPLASIMVLQQLIEDQAGLPELTKAIKLTGIASVAVILIAGIIYISSDYKNENRSRTDAFNKIVASKSADMNVQFAELNKNYEPKKDNRIYEDLVSNTGGNTEIAQGILNALRADRSAVFGKDIFRSLVFVALTFGLIFLYIRKKLNANYMLTGIALLTFIDLYMVDRNYLNENNYIEKDAFETESYPLTEADKTILQDKDPNYRVFNMVGGDPFQDAKTSYYHKSIGGYSPAKLGIYDDLITYQLSGSPNLPVLNMLNAKYIIQKDQQSGQTIAIPNTSAAGNAWIVKQVKFVQTPGDEMKALTNLSVKDTAIVEDMYKSQIPSNIVYDSAASIKQVKFDNDAIRYESVAASQQVALFSEVYYTAGWNAFIDDKPVEYFKANYLLRGITLPAGKHTIDFRFEPKSYIMGAALTRYSAIIIVLVVIGVSIATIRKSRQGAK